MNRKDRRAILDECGAKRKARRLHIRASLLINGYTEASLAAENGISQQCMNKVVHGKLHTARILDMLRAAGAKEKDLFDPAKVMGNAK